MRNTLAATAFHIITLILLPVSLVGYVLWTGKAILVDRHPRSIRYCYLVALLICAGTCCPTTASAQERTRVTFH